MNIKVHIVNELRIAEIISTEIVITNIEDGIDFVGTIYYQNFDKVILHRENITPEFFNLKNKMAGEILQKFSNYRLRLVILGDFSSFSSQSLNDFIYECNRGRQLNFLKSIPEALEFLSK